MNNLIIVNDVTLRDGLQNENYFVHTNNKVKLANLIIDSGINFLEITSFVSPKAIPQLADAKELSVDKSLKNAYFSALVPNLKGYRKTLNTKIKEIVLFVSACEAHNLKNLNSSIDKTLDILKKILSENKMYKMKIRGAVSMVFGSPFINSLPSDKNLFKILDFFIENNVQDITLSDTWGNADKEIFKKQMKNIVKNFDYENFSIHLHDIKNKGLINSEIALDYGIKKFDTSFNGLGGCPYSPEKGGNLNIRTLLKSIEKLGFKLKIDKSRFLEIESFLEKLKKSGISV